MGHRRFPLHRLVTGSWRNGASSKGPTFTGGRTLQLPPRGI
jgi:hypothetical protein